jgi:hypothetical protein
MPQYIEQVGSKHGGKRLGGFFIIIIILSWIWRQYVPTKINKLIPDHTASHLRRLSTARQIQISYNDFLAVYIQSISSLFICNIELHEGNACLCSFPATAILLSQIWWPSCRAVLPCCRPKTSLIPPPPSPSCFHFGQNVIENLVRILEALV